MLATGLVVQLLHANTPARQQVCMACLMCVQCPNCGCIVLVCSLAGRKCMWRFPDHTFCAAHHNTFMGSLPYKHPNSMGWSCGESVFATCVWLVMVMAVESTAIQTVPHVRMYVAAFLLRARADMAHHQQQAARKQQIAISLWGFPLPWPSNGWASCLPASHSHTYHHWLLCVGCRLKRQTCCQGPASGWRCSASLAASRSS